MIMSTPPPKWWHWSRPPCCAAANDEPPPQRSSANCHSACQQWSGQWPWRSQLSHDPGIPLILTTIKNSLATIHYQPLDITSWLVTGILPLLTIIHQHCINHNSSPYQAATDPSQLVSVPVAKLASWIALDHPSLSAPCGHASLSQDLLCQSLPETNQIQSSQIVLSEPPNSVCFE